MTKDEKRVYMAKYRQDHAKEISESKKNYYRNHREQKCASQQRYCERHPERKKHQDVAYRHTLNGQYTFLKSGAKRRGILVTLSFKEFKALRIKSCYYCGGTLPPTSCGIDRIDSSLGYVKGNVRSCCTHCNFAKNSFAEEEFRDWAIMLYRHWASKG